MSTSTTKFPPILGNISEICLVTPNIYQTIDALQPLGVGPFTIHHFNALTVKNRHLRGQPSEFELLVAFAKQNDLVFELMQPLNSTPSLMAEYLASHNDQAGVQHVAFDMDGIPMNERIETMKKRGFEVGMEGIWMGKKGTCRFVYFDTLGAGVGTCFESIEFSEDWEDPVGEVYPRVIEGKK